MDTKSLSSCQVWWAQELFRYHFRIDYRQGKANGAADALFCFSHRSQTEEDKLQAENTRTLHKLKFSLTNASPSGVTSLSGLKTSFSGLNMSSLSLSESNLTFLYQVLIYGTHVLLQLRQSWNMFRAELTDEAPYKASIGGICLKLQELQESDSQAQKIKAEEL